MSKVVHQLLREPGQPWRCTCGQWVHSAIQRTRVNGSTHKGPLRWVALAQMSFDMHKHAARFHERQQAKGL